jgi:hypothetical protein
MEEPALKVAVTGEVIAPTNPDPRPLKKPLAPSYLVYWIGFVNMPVTPPNNSVTPPFTPSYRPSPSPSDFLI